MGRGWKSGSSPGDRCPSPCWGHPRSCAVTRSGDIAPVPAPTPSPAGTWFSKELGGSRSCRSPQREGNPGGFTLFHQSIAAPFPPGSAGAARGSGKVGKTPPAPQGKVWIPSSSIRSWSSGKFQRQEGRDPRDSQPSLVPPGRSQPGKLRHGGAGGACSSLRDFPDSLLAGRSGSRSSSAAPGLGFPCGSAKGNLPLASPSKTSRAFGFYREDFGLLFPCLEQIHGAEHLRGPTGILFWDKNDRSCHSRALWG